MLNVGGLSRYRTGLVYAFLEGLVFGMMWSNVVLETGSFEIIVELLCLNQF